MATIQLNGHESEQTLGDSEGQGILVCCSPWACKQSDITEKLNNNNLSGSGLFSRYIFTFLITIFMHSFHFKKVHVSSSGFSILNIFILFKEADSLSVVNYLFLNFFGFDLFSFL